MKREKVVVHPLLNKLVAVVKQGVATPVAGLQVVDEDAGDSVLAVVSGLAVEVTSLLVKGGLDLLEKLVLRLDVLVTKDANEVANTIEVSLRGPEPGRGHASDKARGEDGRVPINNAADNVITLLGEVDNDVAREQVSVAQRKGGIVLIAEHATLTHLGENATAVVQLDSVNAFFLGISVVKQGGQAAVEAIGQDVVSVEVGRVNNVRDESASGGSLAHSLKHVGNVGHAKRLNGNVLVRVIQLLDFAAGVDMASTWHGDPARIGKVASKAGSQVHPLLISEERNCLIKGLARDAVLDHVGHLDGIVLGSIVHDNLGDLHTRVIDVEPLQKANLANNNNAVIAVTALVVVKLDGVAEDVIVALTSSIGDLDSKGTIDRDGEDSDTSLVVLGGGPQLLAKLVVVSLVLLKAPGLAGGVVNGRRHLENKAVCLDWLLVC